MSSLPENILILAALKRLALEYANTIGTCPFDREEWVSCPAELGGECGDIGKCWEQWAKEQVMVEYYEMRRCAEIDLRTAVRTEKVE